MAKSVNSVSKQTLKKKAKPRGKPFPKGNTVGNRFEKGQSGNPGGRPKIMSDAYKEWLAMVNENDPLRRTNAQLGAAAIGLEMLRGETSAAREIRAATEGDHLELTGKDGAGLVIRVVYDEKPIDGTDNPPPETAR